MSDSLLDKPSPLSNTFNSEVDKVISEIKSAKFLGIGVISGDVDYPYEISKLKRLDITPMSKLTFRVKKTTKRLIIAAEEVFIQRPAAIEDCAVITFGIDFQLSAGKPPKAAGGGHGRAKTGEAGGDGSAGATGALGETFDAPDLFIVFDKLHVQEGNPSASTLLSLRFAGLNGGDGSQGGDGGDAGNGGSGTDAENDTRLGIELGCRHGPGKGGDSGRPGPGGRGGDGGRGGNGGDIVVICPAEAARAVAFSAFVTGGPAGRPGGPGNPGAVGLAGGGGALTAFCVSSPGSGAVLQANRTDLGGGSPGRPGVDGTYQIFIRSNGDLFRL